MRGVCRLEPSREYLVHVGAAKPLHGGCQIEHPTVREDKREVIPVHLRGKGTQHEVVEVRGDALDMSRTNLALPMLSHQRPTPPRHVERTPLCFLRVGKIYEGVPDVAAHRRIPRKVHQVTKIEVATASDFHQECLCSVPTRYML
eukprot:CAMPEP_0194493668 /NCGR_PEP_ID=MMETSP0253-20130528/11820_1 /TAXON_ID=2966 /ORGANISM="Noctiluca scintillans" /LENGTH=144 /DNA_ID=CAMNT_0039334681 /DNA_START=365 /DNA_END=796 /DNA_ORIENTATION=-